jgi:transposase
MMTTGSPILNSPRRQAGSPPHRGGGARDKMRWVVERAVEPPRSTTMNTLNSSTIENHIELIKIAVDMHLRSFRVVRQIDFKAPQPAQRFTPAQFYSWLAKQVALASRVVVCYEAGCFGYEPARRMQQMGVEVLVIAPQDWDEQGKKQVNDKLDAAVMCRRLTNYLCGDRKALSIVYIPSPEEEAQRAQARLREQLRLQLRRMQAMGRSLLLQREMLVSGRWWTAATWQRIQTQMPAWVLEQLEIWKKIIVLTEQQLQAVETTVVAAALGKKLFFGEGHLSHELMARELITAHRFKNPRQVGNYYGLCPRESTTGESRRLGTITKHGSPRLRRLLIQLAWRVVIFQPEYRGLQRWKEVLAPGVPKTSGTARKKAIVALARRLAVDLWRIATGRVEPEALGLRMSGQVAARKTSTP